MAQIVPCPHCRRPLRLPENAPGQAVRCPACGGRFLPGEGEVPVAALAVGVKRSGPPRPGSLPVNLGFGLLVLLIAAGLYGGGEGLSFLFQLGAPHNFLILPALIGLAHWVVAGVALGVLIAVAPSVTVRVLAGVTLGVSALQLLLAVVAVVPGPPPMKGMPPFWNWAALVTCLDALFNLSGRAALLAGLLEMARLILLATTLWAVAVAVRLQRVANLPLVLAAGAIGMTLVMALIDAVVNRMAAEATRAAFESGGFSGFAAVGHIDTANHVLNSLAVLALLAGNAYVVFAVWDRVRRRARRVEDV
jgi:hypothetical protein